MKTVCCKRLEQLDILFKGNFKNTWASIQKKLDIIPLAWATEELLKAKQVCKELEGKLKDLMTQ